MSFELTDESISAWYKAWYERNYGSPCGKVNPSIIAAIRDAVTDYASPSEQPGACTLADLA